MSAYHPLTESEAIERARAVPGVFAPGANLTVREIGDGNLNLVFHIQESGQGKGLILKQALPYAKVVGESWPLTLDRARIESEALMIQGELAPGLAPKVYEYEAELALTIMEDLSDHVIMRRGLIEGNAYPLFAGHIGEFLARTLFFTSDFGMNQQQKKLQTGRFINPELCKITEDLIFDDPYTVSANNNYDPAIENEAAALRSDRELHLEVARLRYGFLTKGQAMLHGDLHTGSIFVTPTSTKVIDPEFAYYGPMGFDIGAVLANLLLNAAAQGGRMDDPSALGDFRAYLLDTVKQVWVEFETRFRALWAEHCVDRLLRESGYLDAFLAELLQDTFGYAGAKMVRRIVGLAHVADIDGIPDEARRNRARRVALGIGADLIKRHRTAGSIGQMLAVANLHFASKEGN
ncbi:S-methyl-5-thioribose kinase [Paenibacillus antri]|uniref:Methylthioribose kinase n=1 Tax=Paenibacillus antri TaxID=2582848 RepID=A0A5R9G9P4_9BACL|nr:S-methyl-5-thioribose kinase [Paenibacillus antri]TLS51086.1 S-methyl-5-thioribose kinase [Paenibacillus antri]